VDVQPGPAFFPEDCESGGVCADCTLPAEG
jgi:hypothetical protein